MFRGSNIQEYPFKIFCFFVAKFFFPPFSLPPPILINFDICLFSVRQSTSQVRNCVYKLCHSQWQNNENVIQQRWLTLKFLFCGIHYDNFSITDYIVSMVGWRVNNGSERIWKEAVVDWPRFHAINYLKYSGLPS